MAWEIESFQFAMTRRDLGTRGPCRVQTCPFKTYRTDNIGPKIGIWDLARQFRRLPAAKNPRETALTADLFGLY